MMAWLVKQVNKKNKGFTLIEMVVVLAIIAVLIAIAVPQVMRQINKAKINADKANAKNIATAIQQYVADGNTINVTTWQPVTDTLDWVQKYLTGGAPKVRYDTNWNFYYKATNEDVYVAAGDNSTSPYQIYPHPDSQANNPYK